MQHKQIVLAAARLTEASCISPCFSQLAAVASLFHHTWREAGFLMESDAMLSLSENTFCWQDEILAEIAAI